MSQVVVSQSANNATVVLYTVPANNNLFLFHWFVSLHNTSGGAATGWLSVRDNVPVVQYSPVIVPLNNNETKLSHGNPSKPLIIPATYDIVIISNAVNLVVSGFIFGYLFSI